MLIGTPLAELRRIADAYPPEAAMTTADERDRYFTAAQRAAWEMRFGRRDRVLRRGT